MATYNIIISDAEEKALTEELYDAAGIKAWLENAIKAKATRRIDTIIHRETTERPDLLTPAEKEYLIDGIEVTPRKDQRFS